MKLGTRRVNIHGSGIFGRWRRWLLAGTVLLVICSVLTVLVVHYQAKAAPCECNVFGTPTGQTLNGGSPLEVGFKFIPSVDGFISGVRFYKQGSMSGTHTGHLWTTSGTSLATATFSGESASGWQSVTFSSPVAVTADTTYVASVDMADGTYLATTNYFTTDIVNGPLTAPSTTNAGGNGVFSTTTGAFPVSTFNAANYWVDVAFYGTSPPTITSVAPAAGSTGSPPGVSVTATFDQAMDATTLSSNTFTVKDAIGNAVSGAVSYNGTTKTATFVAAQGFATSQTYTATIKGGAGTVATNIAGVALASDDTWSFTIGSANPCPCSLKNNANPTNTGTFASGSALELGVKLRPSTNGYITSLRFYKPILSTLTTHTGHVWDTAGNSLASVTFGGESSYGWQEAKLASPLQVYQNQTYVISYTSSDGEYVSSNGTFTSSGISSGYLTVFADGSAENTATGSGTRAGAFSTTGGTYPDTGSATGNYYWVDAVFSTASAPSNPLTVAVTQPTANAYGIRRDQVVTANFSRIPDGTTITNATFRLYNSGGSQVAGTAGYSTDQGAATFTPTSQLTNGQRYTAKIAGTVADASGTALGTEYSWSFTVGSALSSDPSQGSGGPILVINTSSDPYGKYYAEILHAEGLNEFDVKDIATVSTSTLANYKAVILAQMTLSQAQANVLSDWVTAGGSLVAMRPDSKLANLLGLASAGTTLTNQYMLVDTSKAPGAGIVNQTIQFKGAADNYTLNGASTVASLYSDATTSTPNPAVSTHTVGGNGGKATAFAYDLARSVIALHQGNQAWAGQERDGSGPIRTNDLFFGAKTGDIQPDWVSMSKISIPQADEQQRLLANILTDSLKHAQPLPRFWYLPDGYKAVVVMAGDDHAVANDSGTEMTMNNWLNNSTTNCSLLDWQCVRASHYVYTNAPLSSLRATQYKGLGFEIGDHVGTSCNDFASYASLLTEYNTTFAAFRTKYTGLPNQVSHRYHCYNWADWDSQIKVDAALGIRYDLNYVAYPASWIGSNATLLTGSGMNMRFTDATGNLVDVRQGVTNFDDQSVTTTNINAVLDNALGSTGYYGIFGTHYDMTNTFDKTLFAAIRAHNVPMISSQQALDWLDGRDSSSFGSFSGDNGQYSFAVTAAEGANGMQAMMPTADGSGTLSTLTSGGSAVSYQTQIIKGIQYAIFNAAPGSYTATYTDYIGPATPGAPAAGATSTPSNPSNAHAKNTKHTLHSATPDAAAPSPTDATQVSKPSGDASSQSIQPVTAPKSDNNDQSQLIDYRLVLIIGSSGVGLGGFALLGRALWRHHHAF